MPSSHFAGDADGLLRVQAARGGQHHDVGVALDQQRVERGERTGAGLGGGGLRTLVYRVADGDEFGALGVLLQRGEVVLGDASAAHQGEADLAVGDRVGNSHGANFRGRPCAQPKIAANSTS
jgi:hypothetical protein